jgi:tRNA dimethylallyltransferase
VVIREDRAEIPHHLVDIVEPGELFTVADFKELANQAIQDILSRQKLPVMVGGTGLYIDSVLYDFEFSEAADKELRADLQQMSVEGLQAKHKKLGIPLPENSRNPRHLIRQLETGGALGSRKDLRPGTLIVGLQTSREQLLKNIESRVEAMIFSGLLEEVERLSRKYGWESEAMRTPAYKAFKPYFDKTSSLEEAKEQFIKNDMALAKRQRTWFNRNSSIQWFSTPDEAYKYIYSLLNN